MKFPDAFIMYINTTSMNKFKSSLKTKYIILLLNSKMKILIII